MSTGDWLPGVLVGLGSVAVAVWIGIANHRAAASSQQTADEALALAQTERDDRLTSEARALRTTAEAPIHRLVVECTEHHDTGAPSINASAAQFQYRPMRWTLLLRNPSEVPLTVLTVRSYGQPPNLVDGLPPTSALDDPYPLAAGAEVTVQDLVGNRTLMDEGRGQDRRLIDLPTLEEHDVTVRDSAGRVWRRDWTLRVKLLSSPPDDPVQPGPADRPTDDQPAG